VQGGGVKYGIYNLDWVLERMDELFTLDNEVIKDLQTYPSIVPKLLSTISTTKEQHRYVWDLKSKVWPGYIMLSQDDWTTAEDEEEFEPSADASKYTCLQYLIGSFRAVSYVSIRLS
jgi:hypothetical protein